MPKEFTNQIKQLNRQLVGTDDPLTMANIYLQAGQLHARSDNIDEACFFMTQAFIFAIHYGDKSIEQATKQFLQKYDRI